MNKFLEKKSFLKKKQKWNNIFFISLQLQRHTINNITIKITKPMNKKFYTFFVLLYHCRHPILITHRYSTDSRWQANKCDSRNEGYERVVIKDGTNTSGDSSSGGSTSGGSTSGESTSGR